jgi:hypothetical protein
MRLQRVRVVSRSFAAALAYVSTVAMPLAPAAQNLGVGLRRHCRGQTYGGVLGAMARNFPCATRHAVFSDQIFAVL